MEPIIEALAPQLETWIEESRPDLLRDLMDLARIPSVSGPAQGPYPYGEACAAALRKGEEIARRRGFSTRNHDNHCVTALFPGRTERTIGIFCHLDVVAAGNGWQSDPYAPFVKDGHVFGRGVTDNKGPAAAMLSLLQFLRQQHVALDHSILLYLGGSEETGMQDLDWYLAHEAPPELSLTPDAHFSVCNGEKGHITANLTAPLPGGIVSFTGGAASNAVPDTASLILRAGDAARLRERLGDAYTVEAADAGIRISASGRSAHAAFPETGENAIVKLCCGLLESGDLDSETAAFLKGYLALFQDCHGSGLRIACADEPSGQLTAVGGRLRTADGIAEQSLDIRYPVTADPGWVQENLTAAAAEAGYAVSDFENSPPVYFPAEHPMIKLLNDTCNEVLGTELKPYVIGGGTYARKLPAAVACGHLLRSRFRPGGPGKGGGHQADECVSIQGLEDLMRVYLRALIRLNRLPDKTSPKENQT